jgi:hypothetical protein
MLKENEKDTQAERKLENYLIMAAAIRDKAIEIAIGLQDKPTAFELAEGQGRR